MNLIKSMRVRQWTKNVFVLAALIFDKKLLDPHWLLVSLLGFVCFCFLSSSVYLFNDLMDIEADRNHPVKKDRPIASGAFACTGCLGCRDHFRWWFNCLLLLSFFWFWNLHEYLFGD